MKFKRSVHRTDTTVEQSPWYLSVTALRHAKYYADTGSLTPEGVESAQAAGRALQHQLVGERAVLLSSTAPRAVETAERIARVLGGAKVMLSESIYHGGEHPDTIASTDAYLADGLAEAGMIPDGQTDLIVVTHGPLISEIKGISLGRIGHARPMPLPQGAWTNPLVKA